jgi:hypothetical protein
MSGLICCSYSLNRWPSVGTVPTTAKWQQQWDVKSNMHKKFEQHRRDMASFLQFLFSFSDFHTVVWRSDVVLRIDIDSALCKVTCDHHSFRQWNVYIFSPPLSWLRFFHAFFSVVKANARVKLAKTGHGPHSSTLVVICVVLLLFVLFCILFVCKCVLPPGENPIAVNKYIVSYQ